MTEITVRGSFVVFEPPGRGTVHATIAYEGPKLDPVYEQVALDLETVKASITPLEDGDDAPVTSWSAGQLRTWTNRPWNKDGLRMPLVHHASVSLQVKFADFAELSRWVGGRIATTDGFQISQVEWTLSGKRRAELYAQVRAEAVRDAVAKAQQYASTLELVDIRPVAIADAGMLGDNLRPDVQSHVAYARAVSGGGGAANVELVPEDIEVTAAVDARFVAEVR